jgi:hypothetical protein
MPLPWLRLIDGVIGATDVLRWVRGRPGEIGTTAEHTLNTRLAGVIVGALREAFARDHERLEMERLRLDEERRRAERALRLELLRQAGEREIGRLRIVAAVAVACFLGTLVVAPRLGIGSAAARSALGAGWLLLLVSLAAAFSAQAHVARALGAGDDRLDPGNLTAMPSGRAAPWALVAGLSGVALGFLLA